MIERGKVTIVPDENQILLDEYTKKIKKNHLEAFIDFSNKFKALVGSNFTPKPELYILPSNKQP